MTASRYLPGSLTAPTVAVQTRAHSGRTGTRRSSLRRSATVSAAIREFVLKPGPVRLPSIVQEAAQLPATARGLQLAQRLRFDLTDTFARHVELLTNLFQRVIGIHTDTKTHTQHPFLARRERCQHTRCRLAQVCLDRGGE